jgi:hypothetical protein
MLGRSTEDMSKDLLAFGAGSGRGFREVRDGDREMVRI